MYCEPLFNVSARHSILYSHCYARSHTLAIGKCYTYVCMYVNNPWANR